MTPTPPDALAPAPDLLPCPFCGKRALVELTKIKHCQLHGDPYQNTVIRCAMRCASFEGGSLEIAASQWNRRPTPSPVSQAPAPLDAVELDALKAELDEEKTARLSAEYALESWLQVNKDFVAAWKADAPVEGKGPGGVAPAPVMEAVKAALDAWNAWVIDTDQQAPSEDWLDAMSDLEIAFGSASEASAGLRPQEGDREKVGRHLYILTKGYSKAPWEKAHETTRELYREEADSILSLLSAVPGPVSEAKPEQSSNIPTPETSKFSPPGAVQGGTLDLDGIIKMCQDMGAADEPKMPHFWHQEQYRTLAWMLAALRSSPPASHDLDLEIIISRLGELVPPLAQNETGIARLMALRDYVQELLARHISRPSSPPGPAPVCEWQEEDSDAGKWDTACGRSWCFTNDGPKENRMDYCHGCGKAVKVQAEPPKVEGKTP